MKLQKVYNDTGERIETGPLKFFTDNGEDWPGIFIRGDAALEYSLALEDFLKPSGEWNMPQIDQRVLAGLLELLRSCREDASVKKED